jgi:hypothetical protein
VHLIGVARLDGTSASEAYLEQLLLTVTPSLKVVGLR